MTIKAKLIGNLLLISATIVAITLASFFSIRFLQEKLSYLTEKSSPLQIRSAELERELQSAITALIKVSTAHSLNDLHASRTEAGKALERVARTRTSLATLNSAIPAASEELQSIADEITAAAEERIASTAAAVEADQDVTELTIAASARLKELDASIRTLQAASAAAFNRALTNTSHASESLRSIEELRNQVRELQLIAVSAQTAQTSTELLIARGKLKAIEARIARNSFYGTNRSIAPTVDGFIRSLHDYLAGVMAALNLQKERSHESSTAAAADLRQKLHDLFQSLDQEAMLARDVLALAARRQSEAFQESNRASDLLILNSKLVGAGLAVSGEIHRLFNHASQSEVDVLSAQIRPLFMSFHDSAVSMERSLAALNAGNEVRLIRSAHESFETVRSRVYGRGGLLATLGKKLSAVDRAERASERLQRVVLIESQKWRESVSSAQVEQNNSILDVNSMVTATFARILFFGALAICIAFLFGLWVYRSITRHLEVLFTVVRSHALQVRNKADLAEEVANGNLEIEVAIGEPLQIAVADRNSDELGELVNALVDVSEAQVTLDRAFAAMALSLRDSMAEERRRDSLKSALFELNKILRDEQTAAELASRALAFIAAYCGAGVGIIYYYHETEEMLRPIAFYACSRTEQLNNGIRFGEGLVGQVAAEGKEIQLDSVPAGYLPISSPLGEADPAFLAVLPIFHNATLMGVMELGSFTRFNDDDAAFLNQALEGVAVALNVSRSRQLVDELLEQTQAQAEELRVQHEELEQSNEVLLERSRVR